MPDTEIALSAPSGLIQGSPSGLFSELISCWSVSFARRAAERDEPKQADPAPSALPAMAALGERILSHGMIDLLLQPKISLATGAVCGFEALARVRLDNARVNPGVFGPALEAAGAEARFDWMVLRSAFDLAASSPPHCRGKAPISVNVNPSTVATPGFGEDLANLARASHVSLSEIRIELLEKARLDISRASPLAHEMRQAQRSGARFSLDDFATGDSGPDMLDLPVSEMKIDAYYVKGLMTERSRKCLYWIGCMVSLAKRKGMSVCAEGIEHPAQAAAMAQLGVDCGQGYLWSKPLEPGDAFALAALESCPARPSGLPERLAARRSAPAAAPRAAALLQSAPR